MDYPVCDSYVGCHRDTEKPLGTLAGAKLRSLRMKAHKAFDWFWKFGKVTRSEAYSLLAEHLELSKYEAHIGMLDECQVQSVIQYCNKRPWKTPSR